ncbi:MAG: hypothetical protein WAP35_08945 [Solirubrobacterales bacterium]
MADDKKPIQIGFRNGQTVGLKLEADEFDKLVKAIADETPWHTVKDETRELTLRADRVDFWATDDKPTDVSVGFVA